MRILSQFICISLYIKSKGQGHNHEFGCLIASDTANCCVDAPEKLCVDNQRLLVNNRTCVCQQVVPGLSELSWHRSGAPCTEDLWLGPSSPAAPWYSTKKTSEKLKDAQQNKPNGQTATDLLGEDVLTDFLPQVFWVLGMQGSDVDIGCTGRP